MNTPSPVTRYTLRDLPLPAKLVVTTFLISVGIGFLWAMAQIHFKHASPGTPMPTVEDMVARFSGVPWPLEPKPEKDDAGNNDAQDSDKPKGNEVAAVKIKTLIGTRCARCHKEGEEKGESPLDTYDGISKYLSKSPQHPKGHLHTVISATGARKMSKINMLKAFYEQSLELIDGVETPWEDLEANQRTELMPKREAERLAMILWIEAGAPKKQYDADAFPLPQDERLNHLPTFVKTTAAPIAANEAKENKVNKWDEARRKRLTVDALTQSTHAHLLSFSMLWALTGFIFAFTTYSYRMRCVLSPLVLIVQVVDIACWWLARIDGPGPYFAIAIVATGGTVALGLGAQITLSLFNMYEKTGKMVLVLLFFTGAGLFGLTYIKVIAPQLQAEKDFVAKQAK